MVTFQNIIGIGLMLTGTLFVLVAAIGLLRLPDLYLRMSATTKASTLGVGLILAGTAALFGTIDVATRSAAIVLFLLLTVPVAAHMIARAAFLNGVPLWEGTEIDELSGQYDLRTHELVSQSDHEAVYVETEGS